MNPQLQQLLQTFLRSNQGSPGRGRVAPRGTGGFQAQAGPGTGPMAGGIGAMLRNLFQNNPGARARVAAPRGTGGFQQRAGPGPLGGSLRGLLESWGGGGNFGRAFRDRYNQSRSGRARSGARPPAPQAFGDPTGLYDFGSTGRARSGSRIPLQVNPSNNGGPTNQFDQTAGGRQFGSGRARSGARPPAQAFDSNNAGPTNQFDQGMQIPSNPITAFTGQPPAGGLLSQFSNSGPPRLMNQGLGIPMPANSGFGSSSSSSFGQPSAPASPNNSYYGGSSSSSF